MGIVICAVVLQERDWQGFNCSSIHVVTLVVTLVILHNMDGAIITLPPNLAMAG